MDANRIERALQAATDTKDLLIEAGCIDALPELWRRHFAGAKAAILADDNTFAAAGVAVLKRLQGAGCPCVEPLVFPGQPVLRPEYVHIEAARRHLTETGGTAIAVGAGTINDIAKLASHECRRKYMVVATAASVDGFASYGASVLTAGYKRTLPCPAPLAVLADTDVLRRAPPEMASGGYADLIGKFTAGADWIIAEMLELEPLDPVVWDMVQPQLHSWTDRPQLLSKGDAGAFADVIEGLTLSGLAMQALRDTRPASGSEHLFCHLWQMLHLKAGGRPVSHGFKVSLGSLAATAMMETVFSRPLTQRDVDAACRNRPDPDTRTQQVTRAFEGTPMQNSIVEICKGKHIDSGRLRGMLELAGSRWEEIRLRVEKQLLPFKTLKARLSAAGCPVSPGEIGLTRAELIEAFSLAQMIRPRFTVLDLAFDLDWLQDCIDEIFSADRYF